MKIDKRFPLHIAGLLAVGLLVTAIPASREGSDTLLAVIVGALLSTANVLAGFFAIEYSFDKSHATFLKAVLGGMGIRMVAMLAILVALLRFAHLPAVVLVASVLGFYLAFLIVEVLYIQRKVSGSQQNS
ncbi:MAG: hypothetical protein C4326_04530 [Ignavibacteria bacterium]